jgi:hypothetical protein
MHSLIAAQDDMEEFMEHEEEFEARQSISSRGRDTRVHMMPGQLRDTQLKPNVRETTYQPQRNSAQEDRYVEGEMDEYGEGEDSVIEEIVDEQVVEIESGDEEHFEGRQENDGGIDQYLDNIKQEDYVNREEYQEFEDNKDQTSPYRQEEMYEKQYREDGQYHQDHLEQDQEYENEQLAYQNNMMENSPIAENPMEEEMTGSPQYYQAPRAVNPKYRRKYEGMNLNDKSHLVWEQERLQRKRMEKEMRRYNLGTKPYNFRDIDWNPTTNPRMAHFDTEKNVKKSNMWHFSNTSSVPLLSTASSIKQKAAEKQVRPKFDPNEASAKRNHQINNIFHQSSLQSRWAGDNKGSVHAPATHSSLMKEMGKAFMTPVDNRFQYNSAVSQGRMKHFHSSQIF